MDVILNIFKSRNIYAILFIFIIIFSAEKFFVFSINKKIVNQNYFIKNQIIKRKVDIENISPNS